MIDNLNNQIKELKKDIQHLTQKLQDSNKKLISAIKNKQNIKNRLQKEAEFEHYLAEAYLNTTKAIVMILDIDSNIEFINDYGADFLCMPKEKLIGLNFIENFIPENIKQNIKTIPESIAIKKSQKYKEYTNPIIDANRKEHLIAWTNSYITDKNGNRTKVITSGIDITQEKKLSQDLFRQENLYRLTFEEADIGIAHVSLENRWIDTNEYMTNLLGYTKEEFKKLSVSQITYKDDIKTYKKMMEDLISKNINSYRTEKRYISKSGDIIWVYTAVVLLKDENGEPLYFLKIIRDISQVKLLMHKLELERDKFRRIIEFTPIPIVIYSESGKILLTNQLFEESIGYSYKDTPNLKDLLVKIFPDRDIKTVFKQFQDPTKMSNNRQKIKTKDKEERSWIFNGVKLNDQNEEQQATYLLAITDITDIQKKDELMIAQSRQAAMGDMLTMIAHQWRQPLSVISMISNNIKLNLEIEEKIDIELLNELIKTLNEQTQYLSQTIDDFRDFFKPDRDKELIDIDTIINKVNSLVKSSLENSNISLKIVQNSNIKLYTFQNQLLQVLLNIINNAKDAIKENNIENGEIIFSASLEKENIVLKICDNGGGLDSNIIHKLGEPYVTTKSKNGTGLGIYMSKMIVSRNLNGNLYWQNSKDGACFFISVPTK